MLGVDLFVKIVICLIVILIDVCDESDSGGKEERKDLGLSAATMCFWFPPDLALGKRQMIVGEMSLAVKIWVKKTA